jgi:hypothetical protein
MNEIIEIKYCKHCGESIPKTRRKDVLYCKNHCGSTFRNKRNAKEKMKLQEREPVLYNNYKVIKNLFHMGILDFTIETATDIGLDFNYHMGVIYFDHEKEITEFRLFEYSFTIHSNRIKIKKLSDECT